MTVQRPGGPNHAQWAAQTGGQMPPNPSQLAAMEAQQASYQYGYDPQAYMQYDPQAYNQSIPVNQQAAALSQRQGPAWSIYGDIGRTIRQVGRWRGTHLLGAAAAERASPAALRQYDNARRFGAFRFSEHAKGVRADALGKNATQLVQRWTSKPGLAQRLAKNEVFGKLGKQKKLGKEILNYAARKRAKEVAARSSGKAAATAVKGLGRFLPFVGWAVTAMDIKEARKIQKDPSASTTKKVLGWVTAGLSAIGCTEIPVVAQVADGLAVATSIVRDFAPSSSVTKTTGMAAAGRAIQYAVP